MLEYWNNCIEIAEGSRKEKQKTGTEMEVLPGEAGIR